MEKYIKNGIVRRQYYVFPDVCPAEPVFEPRNQDRGTLVEKAELPGELWS